MSKPEDIPQDVAKTAVEAIFEDLRDRRFLKWLFSARPTLIGRLEGEDLRSLDDAVQDEIAVAWGDIIARAIIAAEQRGRETGANIADIEAANRAAYSDDYSRAACEAAERIAAAIRATTGDQ